MKKILATGFIMFSLMFVFVPVMSYAQDRKGVLVEENISGCKTLHTKGLIGVVNCAVDIFNIAIYFMIAGGVVYVIYGAFEMIRVEDKREEAKKTIYYGIIGIFVMISVWGLVAILVNTFGLSTATSAGVLEKAFIK